ncbi:MAG: hypothetical protein LBQ79_10895 [Deltaproteobacteria bacterium]|nr:hypothetical protein [Deltaproteobacteria bacterium]
MPPPDAKVPLSASATPAAPAPPAFIPGSAALSRKDGPPTHIRWQYGNPSRQRNGPASAELRLVSSDGSPMEDASWFYRLLPLSSSRELLTPDRPAAMRAGTFGEGIPGSGPAGDGDASPAPLSPGEGAGGLPPGGLKLVVSSESRAMAEVTASAVVNGRRCYAQTAVILMGDSPGGVRPASGAEDPRWPSFNFWGSGELYWPQAGHTFTLTVREGALVGPVLAWREDGEPVPGAYGRANDGVRFTPDHDPALSAMSGSALKPVIMVAGTPDGGTLSYTFYIHRSRDAGADPVMGFLIGCSAFLLTGLAIAAGYARRRAQRHAAQAV